MVARGQPPLDATVMEDAPRSKKPIISLRVRVISGPDEGNWKEASDRLTIGTARANDLVLSDEKVSRYHLDLTRVQDRIGVVDNGSTNGTFAGDLRIQSAHVRSGTKLRIGRTSLEVSDGEPMELDLFEGEKLSGILGRAEGMRRLMAQIRRAAASEASILVLGETGCGKELIARAIHEFSGRARGPFEVVDCGAMQPTLIGSELFGHERGAFTGADTQHIGAFERANGGTIFLDEIGELPASLQTALLGALERRTFRRLGGKASIPFDARVVSATHRDLRAEVNAGTFRQDVFYRLAVVTLMVPPLRERREDIPLLVEHFLRRNGHVGPVSDVFSDEVMESFVAYRWPGNVRELRNTVESAWVMGEAPRLTKDPAAPTPDRKQLEGAPVISLQELLERPFTEARVDALEKFEAAYVRSVLERSGGSVGKAAELAGVDRSYIARMQRKYGLRPKRPSAD